MHVECCKGKYDTNKIQLFTFRRVTPIVFIYANKEWVYFNKSKHN